MISLDITPEKPSTSVPSSLSTQDEPKEGALSFSELLKGVVSQKDEKNSQGAQNGIVALLGEQEDTTETKSTDGKTSLLTLLQGEEEMGEGELAVLISKELQTRIEDAKAYLKEQIYNSQGYKKAQTKDLPQTLKGLVDMAKKFDIDVSNITLEEVTSEGKTTTKSSLGNDDLVESDTQPKHIVKKDLKNSQQVQADDTPQFEENIKKETKQVVAQQGSQAQNTKMQHQQMTQPTTQQLVQTKLVQPEQKTPKQKADETLQMLLRGDKVQKSDASTPFLTADFSVATAKVIAPQATKESTQNLESLLKGDTQESVVAKQDGGSVLKADSFEVKLNEAKQMTKYLSQDVKAAIDDYKSPFTRVKVQLNPQRLGEVDLTIVQRGKNLHINLTSNNAAINTLAMNANDLKMQLQNNGINNASLNFNSGSQGENAQSQQQQQQHQRGQQQEQEYNYFAQQEEHEEILSSLEIVVPYYA